MRAAGFELAWTENQNQKDERRSHSAKVAKIHTVLLKIWHYNLFVSVQRVRARLRALMPTLWARVPVQWECERVVT